MKKQRFVLLGLGLLLAATSAFSQTVVSKAKIPFDFIVAGKTLPAGEYAIQKLELAESTLAIRSSDLRTQMMAQSNRCEALNAPSEGKLVFHKYGEQYFLAQIWSAGNPSGRELPKSQREVEVAQDYTVQNVIIVADLR
ncbi:MAG TPA: hypothetical protein VLW84_03010 [Terriglobales bacterium]|nr:hypothetical protein [Terriglobales bacterium]